MLWCIKCLGFGGAERLLVSSAQVRDRDSFRYEAAYVLPSYRALATELEAEGVPVHCLGTRDSNLDLRWTTRLRRLLLDGRYDIVHFHLPYAAAVGRLVVRSLPRARRPKTVTTEHNVWNTNNLVVRGLNSLTVPLDAAHVAVHRTVKESIPERHRRRFEVVVHGLPVDRLDAVVADRDAARAELGVSPGEVLVGTVANLRPGKGYDTLLPAARELIDRGLPVRFAAAGVGPLEDEVHELHRRLELGERFLLLGGRQDALRLVAAFDVFVLASVSEGFPVSVMEALATGVPVVASAVGGIPDVVTDGIEGLLVAPARQDQLTDALHRLISDPSTRARMAKAARDRRAQFDIAIAVRRVEAIYREVLAAAPTIS